jgi:hypothetical protein
MNLGCRTYEKSEFEYQMGKMHISRSNKALTNVKFSFENFKIIMEQKTAL